MCHQQEFSRWAELFHNIDQYLFVSSSQPFGLWEQNLKIFFILFCAQAFVDFFSRGLQEEYKRKGIIIQVSFGLVWWD